MSDDEDDPEVIIAKADAEVRIVEARAKLHWTAQAIYTFMDNVNSCGSNFGCFILALIVVLVLAGQPLLHIILGR